MNATTVAIDIAKDVFELAFADDSGQIIERKRLRRSAFARTFDNRPPLQLVMEACGSAHFWARYLQARGFKVVLLPAQHVKPYVRGNKTDRADVDGILRAFLVGNLTPVPVKSVQQQGIQALHRLREHHKTQRTASINAMRGLLREFGHVIPVGAAKVRPAVLPLLEDAENGLPMSLRHALGDLLEQLNQHQAAMARIEAELNQYSQQDTRCLRFMQAIGIGALTATALSASIGDLERFKSGRHLASCLGLTPREFSSGSTRRLGKLTRRGDIYLRTLLIHAARSLLQSAALRSRQGKPLDALSAWALALSQRIGHNKAACAVANKLIRRLWAAEHHRANFDPNHLSQPPVCH